VQKGKIAKSENKERYTKKHWKIDLKGSTTQRTETKIESIENQEENCKTKKKTWKR
jgi:hypothetical protein